MSKIEIDLVAASLKKHAVEPAKMRAIIEDLQIEAQPNDTAEKAPPVKKQYVVLVSDPNDVLPPALDLVAWVLQIPESESPATTQERILRAAYDYNTTKKGRLLPLRTIGDAIENVPAKFFKEADLWVKTKTPVLVIRTNNEIPREDRQS